MQIDLDDEIIKLTSFTEREVKECLAVALYKLAKLNGVAAGKLLGKSEMEFHGLLEKYGCYVNYSEQDLRDDMETLKTLLVEDLQITLGRCAAQYRAAALNSLSHEEALTEYYETFNELVRINGGIIALDPDAELPDSLMPKEYVDFWLKDEF